VEELGTAKGLADLGSRVEVDRRGGGADERTVKVERRRAQNRWVSDDPVQQRETTFRRSLGLADGFAVSIALVFSVLAIGGDQLTIGMLAVPPLFILLAKLLGLYDRDANLLHRTTLDELPKLLGLVNLTALLIWLADGALIQGDVDRPQIAALWIILAAAMTLLRALARAYGSAISAAERCIFVGDAAGAEALREQLQATHAVKAEMVGWLPTSKELNKDESSRELAERIRKMVAECDAHRVIIGAQHSGSDELLDAVRRLSPRRLKVSVASGVAQVVNRAVEVDRFSGVTLLGVRRFEMTFSSQLIKRGSDILGSVCCLIFMSPVMIVTAIAVKLDSPGPVLYRQWRAGRHGEPFQMVKFRSMVADADQKLDEIRHLNEAEGVFKMARDPRITRVGRIIRKFHIDELPQMLNVLQGRMSLVGPRPLPLEEDRRIEGWHRRRLELRPGITGPWQVLGSARIPVREMVKLDYQYVADWSLWNDVRIALLTFSHVARRGGQ
jgi:exopolysaccharide biosynthesis polyprenyl glycosylphosphotransferase